MEYSSEVKKVIFVSYKIDGAGDLSASQLCRDLKNCGFGGYFNLSVPKTDTFYVYSDVRLRWNSEKAVTVSEILLETITREGGL